jgi:carbon storage regulator
MMILTRREGEEIWLDGGKIRVTMLRGRDGKTKIGIDAPRNMTVHRREVAEEIIRRGDDPADILTMSEKHRRTNLEPK